MHIISVLSLLLSASVLYGACSASSPQEETSPRPLEVESTRSPQKETSPRPLDEEMTPSLEEENSPPSLEVVSKPEKNKTMAEAEIKVTLQSTNTAWLKTEKRWIVVVQIEFLNIGGSVFALDKFTACAKGKIRNNVFQVKMAGKKIPYKGRMTKRAHPGADGFFQIQPGQKEVVSVDIGVNYDFPRSGGIAKVRFDHSNHFSVNDVQLFSNVIKVRLKK